MKIWTISDTHSKHGYLDIPLENIDMVIHAGDMGTSRDPYSNIAPVLDCLTWLDSLKHIKYKVCIAGNHDTSVERKLIRIKDQFPDITYLEHESVTIDGINIFGSPYTPTFGTGWAFNVNRDKLYNYWAEISDNTDIVITHGPPKGILDYTAAGGTSLFGERTYVQCGCKALLDRIQTVQPKYHIFGHIHTEQGVPNGGMMEIQGCTTKFINAAVLDLRYEIHNNGYIIEI